MKAALLHSIRPAVVTRCPSPSLVAMAFDSVSRVMAPNIAPNMVSSGGANSAADDYGFLFGNGAPQRPFQIGEGRAETHQHLPAAYAGKQPCKPVADAINGLVLRNKAFFTTLVLPWCHTDQLTFQWNEWQFNNTLAGRIPHEGAPRIITSQTRVHTGTTLRRGLAMKLEHGFSKTEEGRKTCLRQMMGIRNCIQLTQDHDVLNELLNCHQEEKKWLRERGTVPNTPRQLMEMGLSTWACVQKSPKGLDILHERMKSALKARGCTPNIWLFPPNMSMFLTMVHPERTEYQIAGPQGVMRLEEGPDAMTSFRGVPVFETSPFDITDNDPPIDLLRRRRMTGEFYSMHDHLVGSRSDGTYKTHWRDIVIYNENTDNWARISLERALLNTGRFGEADGDVESETTIMEDTPKDFMMSGWHDSEPQQDTVMEMFAFDQRRSASARESVFYAKRRAQVQQGDAARAVCFVAELCFPQSQRGANAAANSAVGNRMFASMVDAVLANLEKTAHFGIRFAHFFDDARRKVDGFMQSTVALILQEVLDKPTLTEEQTRMAQNWFEQCDARCGDYAFGDSGRVLIETRSRNILFNSGPKWEEAERDAICSTASGLRALVAMIVAIAPVGMKQFKFFMRQNVPVPVSVLLFRPFIQHNMSSAILMKGGYETGGTFYGHSDFMLGNDAYTKVHLGNFTFYSKAIVTKWQNVQIAHDVFANGYISGNNVKFHGKRSKKMVSYMMGHTPESEEYDMPSLYACATSCAKNTDKMVLDMLNNDADAVKHFEYSGSAAHFEWDDQAFAESYFALTNLMQANDGGGEHFHPRRRQINSLCFQGHQGMWRVTGAHSGDYSTVVQNRGAWGETYPGCGEWRSGKFEKRPGLNSNASGAVTVANLVY